jgi:hypothetical protein
MIQKTDTNPLTAYCLIIFLLSDNFLISIGTYKPSPSKLAASADESLDELTYCSHRVRVRLIMAREVNTILKF